MLVLLIERMYEVCHLCRIIYIPGFMNIGRGVQAILRFCLRNFRGCNTGNTDVRD
jgi:hypothetical protein